MACDTYFAHLYHADVLVTWLTDQQPIIDGLNMKTYFLRTIYCLHFCVAELAVVVTVEYVHVQEGHCVVKRFITSMDASTAKKTIW